MRATEKHYVTFYSPGTFVSESTRKPIEAWDTRIAAKMAADIKERYGAKPFGFRFETQLEVKPVEASGQTFNVQPRESKKSGIYFLTGVIRTRAEVLAGTDPKEEILRQNMEFNEEFRAIVENRNSYLATMPFGRDDKVVDADGNVVANGSDYH